MTKKTQLLNERAFRGFVKVGNIIIPGGNGFPRFEDLSCVGEVDRMISYLSEDDKNGVIILLKLFGYMPIFVIELIVKMCFAHFRFPRIIAPALKMLMLGLKGLVMTVYYSGLEAEEEREDRVLELLNWKFSKVLPVEDEEMKGFVQDLDLNQKVL